MGEPGMHLGSQVGNLGLQFSLAFGDFHTDNLNIGFGRQVLVSAF